MTGDRSKPDPNKDKTTAELRDNIGQPNTWLNALDKFLLTLFKQGGEFAGALPGASLEVVKEFPVVSSFITGLTMVHQGWEAYKNPNTPQRRTKIGAGVMGGFIALGLGVAGSLVLLGALVAAPFVLPAITISVYAIAFYRDLYTCHEIGKELKKVRKDIEALNTSDPNYQKNFDSLKTRENNLNQSYKKAKMHAFLSFLLVVGFSLALGAVFATGIGGAVIAGAASAVIIGAMTKRIWNRYQEKKALKKALAAKETPEMGEIREETTESPQPKKSQDLDPALPTPVIEVAPAPIQVTTDNATQALPVDAASIQMPPATTTTEDKIASDNANPAITQPADATSSSTADHEMLQSTQTKVAILLEIPLENITLDQNQADAITEQSSSANPPAKNDRVIIRTPEQPRAELEIKESKGEEESVASSGERRISMK